MSKVDEARAVVYLRTVYPGDYTVIDKLIQAVRDEEEKEANETLFPASWCQKTQCDSCPAKGTRYCG